MWERVNASDNTGFFNTGVSVLADEGVRFTGASLVLHRIDLWTNVEAHDALLEQNGFRQVASGFNVIDQWSKKKSHQEVLTSMQSMVDDFVSVDNFTRCLLNMESLPLTMAYSWLTEDSGKLLHSSAGPFQPNAHNCDRRKQAVSSCDAQLIE